MSLFQRAVRGSVANLALVGSHLILQVVSVPILLAQWGDGRYGLWIAINSLYGLFLTVDTGHQNFIGGELLKLVPTDTPAAISTFRAGLMGEVLLAVLELVVAVILFATGQLVRVAGVDATRSIEVMLSLGMLLAAWAAGGAMGGILLRLYQPHLQFERYMWLGVFYRTLLGFTPMVVAAFGGDVTVAAAVTACVSLTSVIHVVIDVRSRFPEFELSVRGVSPKHLVANILRSSVLTATSFVAQLQQHLLLLMVANSLGGIAAIPAFTTIRTVANVLFQATSTITAPVAPDMIRFHVTGNIKMLVTMLRTLTVLTTYITSAGIALTLPFLPYLYVWWTRGRTEFHGPLYALLASAVIIRVAGSSLTSFFAGTNALVPQLSAAVGQAVCVIGCAAVLVPVDGMRAAGLAMLLGEIVGSMLIPTGMMFLTEQEIAKGLGTRAWLQSWSPAAVFVLLLSAHAYGLIDRNLAAAVGVSVLAVMGIPLWRMLPQELRARVKLRRSVDGK